MNSEAITRKYAVVFKSGARYFARETFNGQKFRISQQEFEREIDATQADEAQKAGE